LAGNMDNVILARDEISGDVMSFYVECPEPEHAWLSLLGLAAWVGWRCRRNGGGNAAAACVRAGGGRHSGRAF